MQKTSESVSVACTYVGCEGVVRGNDNGDVRKQAQGLAGVHSAFSDHYRLPADLGPSAHRPEQAGNERAPLVSDSFSRNNVPMKPLLHRRKFFWVGKLQETHISTDWKGIRLCQVPRAQTPRGS